MSMLKKHNNNTRSTTLSAKHTMRQQLKRGSIVAASMLVLTGCNTVTQSPRDALTKSTIKSMEYNSYNFQMTQKMGLKELTAQQVAAIKSAAKQAQQPQQNMERAETISLAKCDIELDRSIEKKVSYEKAEKDYLACIENVNVTQPKANAKKPTSMFTESERKQIQKVMTSERIQAIDTYLLKPLTFSLTGAVDSQAKKAQIDYTMSYQPKNFALSMTFPMLINFDEMSITLDPALALPVLGVVFPEKIGTKWQGKGVKFTLPAEFSKEIPTDLLIQTLKSSITQNFKDLPDDMFTYQNKSQFDNTYGAKKVVQFTMNSKQRVNLADRFITTWIAEIEKQVQNNPDAVKDTKHFTDLLKMVKEVTKDGVFTNEALLEKLEIQPETMAGKYQGLFFINSNDDTTAVLSKQTFDSLTEVLNAELYAVDKMLITNINNAQFTFNPTPENIIDGNKLIEEGLEKYTKPRAGALDAAETGE